MDNLSQLCAPGAQYREEMIAVADHVSLRVITFTPPAENSNPAMVFVSGWVSLPHSWQEVLIKMTQEHTVYYIETREKISSEITGSVDYSVEAVGKDIVALISHFNLKHREYFLFGSSLGATAILDCCRFLKQRPLCLVLVAPNAVFRVPGIWMLIVASFYPGLYTLIKPAVKWYLRAFRLDTASDSSQYEKYCANLDTADPWKLKKAVLDLAAYEVWQRLKNISDPTLIIGASKDKLHEPENLHRMVSMIPHAAYLDMETNSATHSNLVVEPIRKFVASCNNQKCTN